MLIYCKTYNISNTSRDLVPFYGIIVLILPVVNQLSFCVSLPFLCDSQGWVKLEFDNAVALLQTAAKQTPSCLLQTETCQSTPSPNYNLWSREYEFTRSTWRQHDRCCTAAQKGVWSLMKDMETNARLACLLHKQAARGGNKKQLLYEVQYVLSIKGPYSQAGAAIHFG